MSSNKESIQQTLLVAFVLCLVCAVLVAGVALGLKQQQVDNRAYDTERSIVSIAGLYKEGMSKKDVQALYKQRVTPRLVDLRTGQFSDELTGKALLDYDGVKAAKEESQSRALTVEQDTLRLHRIENLSKIYLINDEKGNLQSLILPVRGYGLWGTLYGFIAVSADFNTVVGLGFYDHKETPGLGGEVDNPKWKALWPGKKIYANEIGGEVALSVSKGSHSGDAYAVDALAGASLTSKGVNNLVHFWLGKDGFGPFIQNLRNKGI